MESIASISPHFYREPGIKSHGVIKKPLSDDETGADPLSGEDYLLCVQCHEVITSLASRIFVDGAHFHTYANPNGNIFEIRCFESASCNVTGPATDEFTWFKGYRWKIAYCRSCLIHLGWLFLSGGGHFYGLISDRLVELSP